MNKTITVIEFLKMIEDNNAPEKIIFEGKKYKKEEKDLGCEYDYYNDDGECLIEDYLDYNHISELVKEYVTIVEDKPIIEKLNLDREPLKGKEIPRAIDYLLEGRINEIIEYINKKEKDND